MPHKDPEKARARNLRYYLEHKEEILTKNAEYQKNNAESIRKTKAEYHIAHAEEICARSRAWYASHGDKARARMAEDYAKDPQKIMRRNQRWRKANPEKATLYEAKRRARKKAAPINDLTEKQWETIKQAFQYHCAYCPPNCKSCKNKMHQLTQDHITPIGSSGSHTLHNIVPACRSCNAKKGRGEVLRPVQPLLL